MIGGGGPTTMSRVKTCLVPDPVRVVVADDNFVVRRGLASLVESGGHVVAGEACDGDEAVMLADRLRPHVVLLDVAMPGTDGLSVLPKLVSMARVLMVTDTDARHVVDQALRAGATGYLVYGQFTPVELLDAVAATAAGRARLSPSAVDALVESLRTSQLRRAEPVAGNHGLSQREAEIMEHVVRGRGNAQIASTLFLSEKTIKNHINHINAKLGTRTRAEAIALWLGLASPSIQDDAWQAHDPLGAFA
jgi:DNA-binding NarL/FixJ family response regulator